MTITQRFIADFNDVAAVRLVCKCSSSVSLPPTSPWNIPRECPHCRTPWIDPNSRDHKLISDLLRTIDDLAKTNPEQQWNAQLEFDLPSPVSSNPRQ